MRNQFFYTKRTALQPKEGEKDFQYEYSTDSFNVDKVIRSVEINKEETLIILDDFHVEKRPVPIYNKQGKPAGMKNEENTFNSEIVLFGEDVDRFKSLTAING